MNKPSSTRPCASTRRCLLRVIASLAAVLVATPLLQGPSSGAGSPVAASAMVSAASPSSYEDVPSDVVASDWLMSAWEPNPSFGYSAFRMFCEFSHLAYADPIVSPGDDQFMHLHMFFGNSSADQSSTYESLRSSGGSTCDGGPLNRTAYWMPAVFDGNDEVVVADRFELYYKGENAADPSQIRAKPNGLRMIAGHPHPNGARLVWGWRCGGGANVSVMPDCAPGERLTGWVRFPYCWDGENLDSPDHRSHMAYGTNNTWGPCPASHPVHLPELTEFAHFDNAGGSGEWYLSSDRMDPANPAPNGSTFHADWFGAWDNSIQDRWTNNCIRAARNSSNGNLCDGQQLRPAPRYAGPARLTGWTPTPDGPSHDHPAPPTTSPPTTSPPSATPDSATPGYWMATRDGAVHGFGSARSDSARPGTTLAVVGAPDGGYWMLHTDGRVTARGAAHHGDARSVGLHRGENVSTMAGLPDGRGYWIFTDRGRVLPYGRAQHRGDLLGLDLNGPVVDAVATPDGRGYYLVGSDGGVFSFGSARFRGSVGSMRLNAPVVALIPTPSNNGYWLIAADGGVFAFDAPFRGSVPGALPPGARLNRPVIGGVAYGNGYVMVSSDGGAFSFSNEPFLGSLGANPPASPVMSLAVQRN